jgi:PAS domain S-box-containing protein
MEAGDLGKPSEALRGTGTKASPVIPRRRFVLLALIMVAVCGTAMAAMVFVLYRHDIRDHGEHLLEAVHIHARMVGAVADYDAGTAAVLGKHSPDFDPGSATLGQIADAHRNLDWLDPAIGLAVARRRGNRVEVLHWHGAPRDSTRLAALGIDSAQAGPFRRAFAGKTGTLIGPDYTGEDAIAAYEYVPQLGLAIVASIRLSDIWAPFINAAAAAGFAAAGAVLLGTLVFWRASVPVVQHLESNMAELEQEVKQRSTAEERERDAHANLVALINASPESAFLIDSEGIILICNKVTASRWDMTPAEMAGRHFASFLSPQLAESRSRQIGQVLATGKPLQFEDEREGLHFSNHLYPVVGEEGQVRGVAIFGHDITWQREVQLNLERHTRLLDSLRHAQELFIAGADPRNVYNELLDILVEVTDSAYGFLDEMMCDPDGTPYKLSLALSNISWNEDSQALYQQLVDRKLEFRNLANLSGAPVTEGRTVIANDAAAHALAGGTPPGHPELRCFMGIPLYYGGELVAVAGVANRVGGYTEEMGEFLKPLTQTCAAMVWAGKIAARQTEALQGIRDSEERLRAITEQQQDLIAITDTTGVVTYASGACRNLFGCSPDEMQGKHFARFLAEEAQKEAVAAFRETVAGGPPVVGLQLLMARADGSKFTGELSGSRFRSGGEDGTLVVIRDITDRKQAEEELRMSEERHRTYVQSAPDAVFVVDGEGKYQDVNPAACNLTGYSRVELMEMRIPDLISPAASAEASASFQELKRTGRSQAEVVVRRRDGSDVEAFLSAVTLPGNRYMAFCSDISERKRMEEDLRKAHNLESLGVLAGGIAHDFNNLMMGVSGNLTLLESVLDPGTEAGEILAEARDAALRTRGLTRQLMTFAEGGKPVKKVVSLEALIRETTTLALRGSNTRPEFSMAGDLSPVNVDTGQISQVIQNIAMNADQAMPGGGRLRVSAQNLDVGVADGLPVEPGPYLRVELEDEGIGIPDSMVSQVFDPYFTTKDAGHGVGLSICHSVVRRHGGHISVRSRAGEGTTFSVFLPASDGTVEDEPADAPPPKGHGRVLVMDDEAAVLRTVARMLRKLGYEVTTASDGDGALKAFSGARESGTPFGLVILDLTVPGGMGGREAAARLREMDHTVRVVVASGYSDDEVFVEPEAHGFTAGIRKPMDYGELGRLMASLMATGPAAGPGC